MTVTKNKVVSIDYTLTDEQNNILDSTAGRSPLVYLHGAGNIIPGLEKALEGKSAGDQFSARLAAADAYGERDEELVADIPRGNFDAAAIEPGMQFHAHTSGGVQMFTVTGVSGDTVTVDANHPLAGRVLNFEVTVAGIREASEEELQCGHVHGGCGSDAESCGAHCGTDCGADCGADCGCGGCGGH
jgi:FKBP-type peptidyl-prolyl cis-trans isomerase SlyD